MPQRLKGSSNLLLMMRLVVSRCTRLGLLGINFYAVRLIKDLSKLWLVYTGYHELTDLSSNLINIIRRIQVNLTFQVNLSVNITLLIVVALVIEAQLL